MKRRKTIGLALGSGGIRGLALVGVIKKLFEYNIPIDYIAGSSIGAWVGAHYSLYQDINALEEFTVGHQKEKFRAFLEPTMRGGLIKGIKMELLMDKWLESKLFSDTQIPFTAIATDLNSGSSITITEGKLSSALRASMSIPTLFIPFSYQESLLIDGGVSQPVPDRVVKQMGADIVISVNLDSGVKNEQLSEEKQHSLRYITTRSINIMRHNLTKHSLVNSDFIIEPFSTEQGSFRFIDYFAEKINGKEIVKIGERETEKIIANILKKIG